MRREFAAYLLDEFAANPKLILLTADIGFGILDTLRERYGERVINIGSSESLMIGIAAGYVYEGWTVICYTITPFLLYRPFEMIRNYVNHEKLNIKLVGCGRDRDYIHDGLTHWAEDDIRIIEASFRAITVYKPETHELTRELVKEILKSSGPCYLNLRRN